MRKRSISAVVALVSLIVLAPVGAAYANSYQDDAAQALQSSQLYVDSGVSLNGADEVENALSGSDIAVAVLPSIALESLTPSSFTSELLRSVPQSALIVILNDAQQPLSVAYKNAPSEENARAVYEILADNGNDVNQALLPIIEHLKNGGTSSTEPDSENNPSFSGLFAGIGVLAVICFSGVALVTRKRKSPSRSESKEKDYTPSKIPDTVPVKLHPLIKQLHELAKKHTQLDHGSLASDIRGIVKHVQELFNRLAKKGTDGQKGIAEVEYIDKLTKLIEALGDNYYVDIIQQPELWDNSDTRLDSVRGAVQAVKDELVKNIQQVNASKDLEFQVVLSSLMGSANAIDIEDIYNPDQKRKNK